MTPTCILHWKPGYRGNSRFAGGYFLTKLRIFEKYAVSCGGGSNHRFGLYDAVMIKDNHIKASGGISQAIRRIRKAIGKENKIEVETKNLNEVREALEQTVDIIMLDNMSMDSIY